MSTIENLAILPYEREQDRQDALQQRIDEAHARLSLQLASAIAVGLPQQMVETPGGGKPWTTAADVLSDHFAGESGIADFADLIWLAGRACTSTDDDLRAHAIAWRARVCKAHADFHAADAVWGEA